MTNFAYGPFTFEAGETLNIASAPSRRWRMYYGHDELAEKVLPAALARWEIVEQFGNARAALIADVRPAPTVQADPLEHGYIARLVRSTEFSGVAGKVLDQFLVLAPIDGMQRGLIDDRHETWLHAPEVDGILPMGAEEFARLKTAHEAIKDALLHPPPDAPPELPLAWVQALLPDDVLTEDKTHWRAPTAWEIRHVVGEGSFSGITGAEAAELVGGSPQGFRKYLAADGAKNRQPISYAAWHLLLHKLGVKQLGETL